MSIFGFRTRSAERDEATDAGRLDRLERLLDQLTAEISVEKAGLETRYWATTTDAAFLVDAIENDGVSERSNDRVEDLTAAILNREKRLAVLARQVALLDDFRKELGGLAAPPQAG